VSSQNIISGDLKIRNLNGVLKATDGIVSISEPVMYYLGFWNANTNTPYLHNGTGVAGSVYKCDYAGIVNFGNGDIAFNAGDLVLYDGFVWDKVSSSGSGGGTSARNVYNFTATAGQTVFYLPYTPNQVDVYYNGSRLNQSLYIADNGAYVTLLFIPLAGDILTFNAYTVGIGVIARNVYNFTATNGQVLYTFNYIPNQLDVYYNGSRITQNLYDANSGTSVTLFFLPIAGDILTFNAYISTAGVTGGGTAGSLAKWSNTSVLTDAIAGADYVTPSQLSSYVPNSRTLTINGVTYDLSANRTWTIPAGISSVVGTLPISVNTVSGAATVSISQSTTSTNGYLSSTDWNTFNNKQNALGYTPENVANKSTSTTLGTSNTLYPTQNAVKVYVDSAVSGGIVLQGNWNAALNIPDITGTTTTGWAWIVSVAGSTNLGGITDWQVGDIAVKSATGWIKIDNTDQVLSVFGRYGAVVAQTGDYTTTQVTEGTNLYYLDSRARAALSFVAGSGAYNSTTGVITIPTNNNQITNGANYITLASLSATTPLFYNNTTGVFTIQQSSGTQSGYLSSTDWTTFNNKGNGTVTSVAASITGNAVGITGSPITTTGTLAFAFVGTNLQYINGAGDLTTFPTLTGFVPYTGATSDVNIGSYNFYSNAYFGGFTSVAASGTQIVLTISSTPSYLITGSGGQTIKLPNATTLPNGTIYSFNNNQSSGAISVNNNSNTLVKSVPSGGYLVLTLIDNSTSTGSWDSHFQAPSNVFWSTNTFDYVGSITGATWNGVSVAVNRGGTGQSSYTDGQILIGNSTGNTLSKSTLSAGTGISITNGSGTITIESSLTNPVTGTGTTNTLPKFTDTSTIGNSNITDDGSLITLGSNSYVNGSLGVGTNSLTGFNLRLDKNITGATTSFNVSSVGQVQSDVTATAYSYRSSLSTQAAAFTVSNLQHYFAQQGTIGAGSTVTNQYGFNAASSLVGATNNYGFFGNIPISGTSNWNVYMSGTAPNYFGGAIGVGSASLTGFNFRMLLNLTGATTFYNIYSGGAIQSDVTANAHYFRTNAATQATAFTLGSLYHYTATQSTIGSGSTVTNQYGFIADSTLIGATNNYGFYGQIASGTNRWNLYMSGDADNFMLGRLGIGTAAGTTQSLRISKTITGGTTAYGIFNTGTVQSDVTSTVYNNISQINTLASSFTLSNYYHYGATQGTIGSGSVVTNQMGFFATGLTGATNNYGFYGNIVAATGSWNLYMVGSASNYIAGSLGIGSTSLTGYSLKLTKTITGAATSYGIQQDGVIQSDVTSTAIYYGTNIATQAASFTLTSLFHYRAAQSTIGSTSSVTNQYGIYIDASLIGATNNYAFYGNIPSATGRYNLYMNGTATNFLQGELQLGSGQVVSASVLSTVTNKIKLIINGTTYYLLASTSGT